MGEKRKEIKDNSDMYRLHLRGFAQASRLSAIWIDDRCRSSSHGAGWYTGNPHDKIVDVAIRCAPLVAPGTDEIVGAMRA